MLEAINVVTCKLQTKEFTLSACRHALNTLLQAVEEEKFERMSPLFGWKLGSNYIGPNDEFIQYGDFERAVVKIRDEREDELTDAAKSAVLMLLKANEHTVIHFSIASWMCNANQRTRRTLPHSVPMEGVLFTYKSCNCLQVLSLSLPRKYEP